MNEQDCADLEQVEPERKEKLVKITARIGSEVNDVIYDLASEFGVSVAQIVRLSIDGHLEKYLGTVRYIDVEQGEEIKECICKASNEMQGIQNQIRWIGNNINQLAKYMNMGNKIEQLKRKYFAEKDARKQQVIGSMIRSYEDQQKKLKLNEISVEDLNEIMNWYDSVVEELGDALWHIQG